MSDNPGFPTHLLPSPFDHLAFPLDDIALVDILRPILRQCTGVATACQLAGEELACDRPEAFAGSLDLLSAYCHAALNILEAWWEPKEQRRRQTAPEEDLA